LREYSKSVHAQIASLRTETNVERLRFAANAL
jgi:hypothetical protein